MLVRATTLSVILLLAATAARAGQVRGVIWPTAAEARLAAEARAAQPARPTGWFAWLVHPKEPETRPASASPGRQAPRLPALHPQPALREAVVWLADVPERIERGLAARARQEYAHRNPCIVQDQSRFTPRVSAVVAGTDIEFRNLDTVWHNVFSVSRANRFDLGKCPPGRIDTVHFERPGLVNLHCDIHPEETAFVMVAPNHAFARPDPLGRFELPKLPPGRYELVLWHPRLGERRHEFEVPKRGDVDLDVSF